MARMNRRAHSKPESTKLGRRQLPVTRIGVGLAAVGRPGYITLGRDRDLGDDRGVEDLKRRAFELLDTAWARGVRYVDAARSYGRAEAFLSAWLDERGHRPSVGSKWGYTYTADWKVDAEHHEVKDHGIDVLERQCKESLDLLGDRLGLYQIHSATLDSGVLDDAKVHRRLAELRAEHGIAIGLSLSGPKQGETLERAIDVTVDGAPLFDAVQATYNLLETSVAASLQRARAAGIGVIVKEGVANGRLTERGLGTLPPELARVLAARAEAHDVTVDAVAIAAVLSRPWVDVVLSGAVTVAQLDMNLAASDVAWSDEDERLRDFAEAPDRYWKTRKALPWT